MSQGSFRGHGSTSLVFPLRLSVDDDGAFKSDFADLFDEGGTCVNVVPPEAHHQLGVIERHNGTLRMLLESIVDSKPCATPEEVDIAICSATYAKNAATWSSGRPPYIAAFGKIPRIGTDLVNDQRALVAGSSRSEAQQQAALMRAEALKAASSTLRRALLRKTNTDVNFSEPQPGSLLAYWRWTTRSHRKRGGYRTGRYLGKDSDGKGYWLQSGSQTVRVAPNQLRDVFGYEQYIPDKSDIKALRDAEANLRSDSWQDETPPDEMQRPNEEQLLGDIQDIEFPEGEHDFLTMEIPQAVAQQHEEPLASPFEDLPPRPMSPQTVIHMHQHLEQTQNVFGSPDQQGVPAPFTSSRRIPRTRSAARSRSRPALRQSTHV